MSSLLLEQGQQSEQAVGGTEGSFNVPNYVLFGKPFTFNNLSKILVFLP